MGENDSSLKSLSNYSALGFHKIEIPGVGRQVGNVDLMFKKVASKNVYK